MSNDRDEFYEELDYEVDEDALLGTDDEGKECELVKQMSQASFTSSDTPTFVASQQSSLLDGSNAGSISSSSSHVPPNFNCTNDFWLKSISTLSVVMNKETDETLKENVATEDGLEHQRVQIEVAVPKQSNKEVLHEPVQKEVMDQKDRNDNIMDLELDTSPPSLVKNLETTGSGKMNGSIKITGPIDSIETSRSNGRVKNMSPQFPSAPSTAKAKLNRNKKRNRRFINRSYKKALLNVSADIPSLMSITPFTNGSFNNFDKAIHLVGQRTPCVETSKKSPFIIQVPSNEAESSRRVLMNRVFDGFAGKNPSNVNSFLKTTKNVHNTMDLRKFCDKRNCDVNKRAGSLPNDHCSRHKKVK